MKNLEKIMADMNLNDDTYFPSPPQDLIDHLILPRIRVKSLLRFKCVSKIWKQTISSPEFAKDCLDSASSCHQFRFFAYDASTLPFEVSNMCYLSSYDEGKNVMDDLSQLDLKFYVENIVGSANGLVCFFIWRHRWSFSVWNPATREYRDIDNLEGAIVVISSAFGYVSSLDDYKIVASVLMDNDQYLWCCVYWFSLRASKWEKIGCLDHYVKLNEFHHTVLVGDNLYCIREVRVGLNPTQIFARYNLVTKELNDFPRLNWLTDYSTMRCNVVRGCLTLICEKDERIDAWTLRQSSDWSSWDKMFSLNLKDVEFHCISEAGRCLVTVSKNGARQLKLIDPNQETSEESLQGIDFEDHISLSVGYKESLISPVGLAKADADVSRVEFLAVEAPVTPEINRRTLSDARVTIIKAEICKRALR